MARRASIDVIGAILFTAGIAALMICLTEFGLGAHEVAWAWAGAFGIVTLLFIAQERRAVDPMVSFQLWSRRVIATVNGSALIGGMALIGVTSFVPMYVQVVLGQTPVVAGLTLTMVMLGWPVGATLASRTFLRFGLWRLMIVGGVLLPLGASAFALLRSGDSPMVAGLGSFVLGLGMGLLSLCSLIIIQESVNNARKHARAPEVAIYLYIEEGQLVSSVRDRGRGFNLAAVESNYNTRGSLGLLNMRERARLIGGEYRIRSAEGETQKLKRELEDARSKLARGAGVSQREVLEMREAVELKDREIRRLKEANLSRERLLGDSRDNSSERNFRATVRPRRVSVAL